MTEWEKVENKEAALKNEGDTIEGTLVSVEESSVYPGSKVLQIDVVGKGMTTVYAGKALTSMILNGIAAKTLGVGQPIKITYLGKRKAEKSKQMYNDYRVFGSAKPKEERV